MLKEVLDEGYALYLTDTTSTGLDISGLDCSGRKFMADGAYFNDLKAVGTNLSNGSISDMTVFSGDLSSAMMKEMTGDNFMALNAALTKTAGLVLDPQTDANIRRT